MVERYKILRKWDKVLERGAPGGIGGGGGELSGSIPGTQMGPLVLVGKGPCFLGGLTFKNRGTRYMGIYKKNRPFNFNHIFGGDRILRA